MIAISKAALLLHSWILLLATTAELLWIYPVIRSIQNNTKYQALPDSLFYFGRWLELKNRRKLLSNEIFGVGNE
jgi:hypothetical protein